MRLSKLESRTIRSFLEANADKLTGRVLDYGCGQQSYRDIVEKVGGQYHGFDSPSFGGSVVSEHISPGDSFHSFNTVICTQVIQYANSPSILLRNIHEELIDQGILLMTGPTNWPCREPEDKWRFTTSGILSLLHDAGFREITVDSRASVRVDGEEWSTGWKAVCQA